MCKPLGQKYTLSHARTLADARARTHVHMNTQTDIRTPAHSTKETKKYKVEKIIKSISELKDSSLNML